MKIRNARRNVPVRIRRGIVRVEVEAALAAVVAVAAHNQHRAQIIP